MENLLNITHPFRSLNEIVLSDIASAAINDLIKEHKNAELLVRNGWRPSNYILFYGPSGCGKTAVAEGISTTLNMPLATVRLEGLLIPFNLEEIVDKLQKIFYFASNERFILVFDNIDAIVKRRIYNASMSEISYIFMELMDKYVQDVLMIATSNEHTLLDKGIFNRFYPTIFFGLPDTKNQFIKMLQYKLKSMPNICAKDLAPILPYHKGRDLDRIVSYVYKHMLLEYKTHASLKDFKDANLKLNVEDLA